MTFELGSTVKGTVVKIANYGAIVRLPGGDTGLVHISEIADAYVRDVRDYLQEGEEVTVKILRLDTKGRYDLSIRQCSTESDKSTRLVAARNIGNERRSEQRLYTETSQSHAKFTASFEDRLSRFLKDSEERLHDLKRNIEAKRGRR